MAKQPRRRNGQFGPMPRPRPTVRLGGYTFTNLAHYVHDMPRLRPIDTLDTIEGIPPVVSSDDTTPDDPGAPPKRRRRRPKGID